MNWNPRRFAFVFFAIFLGSIFNGCGSSTPRLTALTITPATASIVAGNQQQFTATGLFSDGTTKDQTSSVTWASSNTAVATIVAGGLATGVSAGTANITATLSGITSGAAVLTVTASSTLQSIAVTPALPSISVGLTQQFVATGTYKNPDGSTSTKDISGQVTWNSGTTTVATISTSGLATAVAAGTSVISATLNGISGQTTLTVTVPVLQSIAVTPALPTIAAGATQQFTATGTYKNSDGSTSTKDITGQVTWNSATTTVATINTSGLATAVAVGTSVISATLGVTGQTTLTVTPAVAVGLKVSPANPNAAVGTTVQFSARELFSNGTTQPLTGAVTWTSGTTATATIGATSGLALALAVGTSVITATEAGTGFTGTSTLTVVAAQARFAYLADANASSLDAYSVVASTGTFTRLTSPVGSQGHQQVIVHPSGHFLYVIDNTSSVSVYDVNSTTGAATLDSTINPVPAGVNALITKGVVDRTGSFFFAISSGNTTPPIDALFAYAINQTTGALTAVAGSPFTTNLNAPTDVLIAHQGGAANDYLYVIDAGSSGSNSNTVAGFSINPTTGIPTALGTPTIPTGSFPQYSTIDPSGTHLYVPNGNDKTVSAYSIATTGILTQVGTATTITDGTTPATFVFNVAVDPSGKYLYVVDEPSLSAPGAVYGFNIGTNGAIGTSIGLSVVTGNGPTGIVIDPTGVLLAVDDNGGASISPFKLGAGGVLTAYPIVTTGAAPQFLAFYTAVAGQ